MHKMLRYIALLGCLFTTGCSLLPEIAHQPTVHNPFPQLSKIAVTPFFNHSAEPTVDGRRLALAYYNELQLIPGFEVLPVEVVERAIQDHHISMYGPADARLLAQILKVDAVVVGSVTDFCAYYPPRLSMQVEWYAANPNFHPIPPGYGLPWGTPEERDIPAPLVFEAELALAKAQLKTQTPPYEKMPVPILAPDVPPAGAAAKPKKHGQPASDPTAPPTALAVKATSHQAAASAAPAASAVPATGAVPVAVVGVRPLAPGPGLPPDWPDARGFIPPPPSNGPALPCPSDAPVLRHTRTYNGNDSEFTEALASYYFFRDDARMGGWQAYLQRSDDFIRFCCHMHIAEMLSARGGAGETRVVWRWPKIR